MAMKKTAAEAPVAETKETPAAAEATKTDPKTDSGTAAAVARMQASADKATAAVKSYGGNSYNDNARGKTRCVQFEAALMSPAIAGMKFKNIDEYLALVAKAADAGVAYTFDELPKK